MWSWEKLPVFATSSSSPTPLFPLCSQWNLGMEVIGEEKVNEPDRSEDGGAMPTRFGIDSSSQSATSHVPPAGTSRGRHGSSSVPRAVLPRPSSGVQRVSVPRPSPPLQWAQRARRSPAFPVLPVGHSVRGVSGDARRGRRAGQVPPPAGAPSLRSGGRAPPHTL
jgi:hypothetical protein